MRIVCLSDTHGAKVPVPDGDVLIHAGDMTNGGTVREIRAAAAWLGILPHRYKLVIAGNHDFGLDPFHAPNDIAEAFLADAGLVYLRDWCATLPTTGDQQLIVYGSPWTPPFYDWAFQLPPEEIAKKWAEIPPNTDILITHGPPFGILDRVGGQPAGCPALRSMVELVTPKLHVFGHIHEGYGKTFYQSLGTVFVNASICGFGETREPIVVDL